MSNPERSVPPEMPTSSQLVEDYLSRYDALGLDDEPTERLTEDFSKPDKPLANTLVLIPVAAHQEADNIERAMALYAAQQPREPFSVLLYLNHPKGADQDDVTASLSAARQAQSDYPELDLRISHPRETDETTTIGRLRTELWTAAARLAFKDGCFEQGQDVIGLNHDIDLISLGWRYIDQVQTYYQNEVDVRKHLRIGSLLPAHTRSRHAWSHEHPNTSMFVALTDMAYLLSDSGYDASAVFPFSYFVQMGGFYDSNYGEVQIASDRNKLPLIPTSLLETSPRRYLARLAVHGPGNIWTPDEDSFGANDEYRTIPTFTDISRQQLQELVRAEADRMHEIVLRGVIETVNDTHMQITPPFEAQELYDVVTAKIDHVARQKLGLLRRMVGAALDDAAAAEQIVPLDDDITALCEQAVDSVLRVQSMHQWSTKHLPGEKTEKSTDEPIQFYGEWVHGQLSARS